MNEIISSISIIISVAVFVVAVFKKLKLSPVLGYFVAGSLIGENGFNIITTERASEFGEFGVIFLLFAIGLELTFERLKAMRRNVFGFGSLQVILTAIIIGVLLKYFGIQVNSAMIIAGGLALSSTAIVLQVLAENREQSTQVGRLSLAILIMQDFAVVPLLVLVPILSGEHNSFFVPMADAFAKAIVALIVILIVGRLMLRPVFNAIGADNSAKSNELFIATTLLIAMGTAWSTHAMGLSHALGAFVAGLLVAETEFQLQAEEAIAPFKTLLLGLFFMSVGMSIDFKMVIAKLPLIVLVSGVLILLKSIIIIGLSLLFGFTLGTAIHTGFLLSQGGEFAFILFRLAQSKGIIDTHLAQIMLIIVTVSMALTPLMSSLGRFFSELIDKTDKMAKDKVSKEIADLNNHVIILGFGRVGKMIAMLLEAENVNYIAIDLDPELVSEKRKASFPIYLGDASNIETLKLIGVERCSAIILAMENQVTVLKISKIISTNFPHTNIIARSEDLSNFQQLHDSGVKTIVPEVHETGLQLGGAVLRSIGVSDFEINRIKNQFRAGNYIKLPKDDELENE